MDAYRKTVPSRNLLVYTCSHCLFRVQHLALSSSSIIIRSLALTPKHSGVFRRRSFGYSRYSFILLHFHGSLSSRRIACGVSVALVRSERARMSFGVDISKLTQSKRLALEVQTRSYLQFFRENTLDLHLDTSRWHQ